MKAKFLMFTAVLCAIHGMAGAVTIKKAAPVSTQKKEVLDNGSSLKKETFSSKQYLTRAVRLFP